MNNVAPKDAETPENKEALLKLNMEKTTHNSRTADLKDGDMVKKQLRKWKLLKAQTHGGVMRSSE